MKIDVEGCLVSLPSAPLVGIIRKLYKDWPGIPNFQETYLYSKILFELRITQTTERGAVIIAKACNLENRPSSDCRA